MEQPNKYIAAIDIGTTKIVALVAQVNYHNGAPKINVLDYGVQKAQGMKRGLITDMGAVIDSIKAAANKAKFYSNYDIDRVYVGVSGHLIKSQVVHHYKTIPNGIIEKQDINDLLREVHQIAVKNSEEILHIIPYSYIIDRQFEHKNPISIEGKRIDGEFFVITAERSFVKSITQVVKQAGFNIKRLIFSPLAAAEAVLNEEEKEAGVAFVDIGGGTTDIIIIHENKILYSDVIPFGGMNITEDIRKVLQILAVKAEELKIKHGNALALKHLDNKIIEIPVISGHSTRTITERSLAIIIQSRLSEIIDTVWEKVEPFVNDGKLAAGFTITGGTSMLNNILTLIKYRTNQEVRKAYPSLTDIEELNKPEFASTQGLILLGNKYLQTNETPEQSTEKTKKKKSGNIISKMSGLFNKFMKVINDEPDDFDE